MHPRNKLIIPCYLLINILKVCFIINSVANISLTDKVTIKMHITKIKNHRINLPLTRIILIIIHLYN